MPDLINYIGLMLIKSGGLVQNFIFRMLALKLRNNFFHYANHLHIIFDVTTTYQFINFFIRLLIIIFADLGYFNFRIKSRQCGFRIVQYLFVQFFSITKSCKFNFYIFSTTEFYHSPSQVDNFDGISHVKYKDFPTITHCSGFKNQFTGFRYQHEISNNIGMGNSYRTSLLDLFFK